MSALTRRHARATSLITFRHVDGSEQGGAVGYAGPEFFTVTSAPRYGDTSSRPFRYDEVAEILDETPRVYVPLRVGGEVNPDGR